MRMPASESMDSYVERPCIGGDESILQFKVVLQFCRSLSVGILYVADNHAMFQQGNARTDVHGVLKVVTGDEDGGSGLPVVILQEVLYGILAGRVEEVEGFVQDEHLGLQEHGAHYAHLLLVAGRVVADEFLLPCHFACHEVPELLEEGIHILLLAAGDAPQELEILVGCKVVDQEGFVHEGPRPVLPVLSSLRPSL